MPPEFSTRESPFSYDPEGDGCADVPGIRKCPRCKVGARVATILLQCKAGVGSHWAPFPNPFVRRLRGGWIRACRTRVLSLKWGRKNRADEHTYELLSLMRNS